jgi:hypothetical protein
MRLRDGGYDGTARKLADGLYRFEGGTLMWIEGGVLFLPIGVLHPVVALTCGRPIRGVEDDRGKPQLFMRAAYVMEESPDLAELIKAAAAKYQCLV